MEKEYLMPMAPEEGKEPTQERLPLTWSSKPMERIGEGGYQMRRPAIVMFGNTKAFMTDNYDGKVFSLVQPKILFFDPSSQYLIGDTTVGRSPDLDIVLNDGSVSRQHARFEIRPNDFMMLFDNSSTNGTFVQPIDSAGSNNREITDSNWIYDFDGHSRVVVDGHNVEIGKRYIKIDGVVQWIEDGMYRFDQEKFDIEVMKVKNNIFLRVVGKSGEAVEFEPKAAPIEDKPELKVADRTDEIKRKFIKEQLDLWIGQIGERDELESKLSLEDVDGVDYLFTSETWLKIREIREIVKQVEEELDVEIAYNKPLSLILVPKKKFCKRGGFAQPDGSSIIIDGSRKDYIGIAVHELLHVGFAKKFGNSNLDFLVEGAATFFSRALQPGEKFVDLKHHHGYEEARKIARDDEEFGLSHTQVVEKVNPKLSDNREKYEHSYRFGYNVVELIVNNFGKEVFMEIYKESCSKELIDEVTDEILVNRGRRTARQRDVFAQVLRNVSANLDIPQLRPDKFTKLLDAHLKAGVIEKPVRGFIAKVLGI